MVNAIKRFFKICEKNKTWFIFFFSVINYFKEQSNVFAYLSTFYESGLWIMNYFSNDMFYTVCNNFSCDFIVYIQ